MFKSRVVKPSINRSNKQTQTKKDSNGLLLPCVGNLAWSFLSPKYSLPTQLPSTSHTETVSWSVLGGACVYRRVMRGGGVVLGTDLCHQDIHRREDLRPVTPAWQLQRLPRACLSASHQTRTFLPF